MLFMKSCHFMLSLLHDFLHFVLLVCSCSLLPYLTIHLSITHIKLSITESFIIFMLVLCTYIIFY